MQQVVASLSVSLSSLSVCIRVCVGGVGRVEVLFFVAPSWWFCFVRSSRQLKNMLWRNTVFVSLCMRVSVCMRARCVCVYAHVLCMRAYQSPQNSMLCATRTKFKARVSVLRSPFSIPSNLRLTVSTSLHLPPPTTHAHAQGHKATTLVATTLRDDGAKQLLIHVLVVLDLDSTHATHAPPPLQMGRSASPLPHPIPTPAHPPHT